MRSTAALVHEHQVIERVLQALDQRLQQAAGGEPIPVEFLRGVVAFSQGFIDRCHHGKEERCLFPCLERRGVPREGGPIDVMLQEHEMGRALVRQIAEALQRYEAGAATAEDVLEHCRAYVDLLRGHIAKENTILFPIGDVVMDGADHDETLRCYEGREAELGSGEHERWVQLADAMAGSS